MNVSQQEKNLEALFTHAPALIAILRGREGVIELFNPMFRKVWRNRDVVGKTMRDAWPELEGQGYFEIVEKVYATGEPVYGNEYPALIDRYNNKKYEETFFNFVFQAYRDDNGHVVGVMMHGIEVTDQVKARHKIAESEERYQAFIKNSNVGIWRFELDEPISAKLSPKKQIELMYRYAYLAEANDAMAAMYGYKTADALVGARLGDMLIKSDPTNITYLTSFVESDYRLSGTESHEVDKEGNDKFFNNSLVGIVQNGKLIRAWGTQQDVTEKYKADAALRESQERLALALQASKLGTWEWNMEAQKLVWNEDLKRIYGLEAEEEITYEKYLKMVHPDDLAGMRATIADAIKKGKSYRVEHRVVWADGSMHWVLGQGKAIQKEGKTVRMIGTSMNIDERKKAELRIAESERSFRELADSMPQIVWTLRPDGQIDYYNRRWYEYTGFKEGEDNDGWKQILHPDDLKRAFEVRQAALKTGEPYQIEARFKDPKHPGEYRWFLVRAESIHDEQGNVIKWFGSSTDIEDIKEVMARKQELELQQEELIRINNAKDEFISLASHQLRTPATGVKQLIGMLLEGYVGDLSDQQREILQIAFDSNERQLKIVDDLLKIARVDAGKVKLRQTKCDIGELMQEIIEEQEVNFTSSEQKVSFKMPVDLLEASIDRQLIRMVLENILDNARKYSYKGSTVKITVKDDSKGFIAVRITDHGVGISSEDQARLFDKFMRIDNPLSALVGGSGLGLYWAKKIVDLHGGSVRVRSEVEKGSTFTIYLPKAMSE
ncbi:MAG: hypothetical protein JWL85_158 [Candidatus Saccharibacteria bacterium]|nr:hypothetical protein [Candidatus Saccharibacteria bacterium]